MHPLKNDDGFEVYCFPHWAKEWNDLKVKGQPISPRKGV